MFSKGLPLLNVKVAAPCPADWNGMIGNDRVRFCGQCNLNVYNLSSMSRKEAEDLIQCTEGRLCVRFYRRQDGTVLTDNCPVGLRAIKRRTKRIINAVASAVLSFAAGLGLSSALTEKEVPNVTGKIAVREAVLGDMIGSSEPASVPLDKPEREMGKIFVRQGREATNAPAKRHKKH